MIQGKEYYAFISYKSEDVEWAIWLQHELEHYHLPASFNGRTDIRQELRPVFRDIDELAAGNLPEQIKRALENSQNLIVVCSPQAAASPWVNQEVQTFIALGRTNRIFPFIVEGSAPKDFFPPALLALPKSEERLGGDVSKNGRDAAFVKVVSGMLGVAFDSLWQRYEREKATKEREEREKKEKLLIAQSRFVAEKASSLIEENSYLSRRLLLEVLPNNLDCPNRPLNSEAETALREAYNHRSFVLDGGEFASYSSDGNLIVSASHERYIKIWDAYSGALIKPLDGFANCVNEVHFSPDMKQIASISADKTIKIIDIENGNIIKTLKGHTDYINSIEYSSDGKRIVSASSDYTIRVWCVEKEDTIMVLQGHTGRVMSAKFNVEGNYIASISCDKTVRIWSAETGENLHIFNTESNNVNSVCFSPNGKTILSNDHDVIKIWDVATEELRMSIHANDSWGTQIHCVAFNPDGHLIVSTCSNKVKIWNTDTGKLIKTIDGVNYGNGLNDIYSVSFSPSGREVMYCSFHKIWIKEIESTNTTREVCLLGDHRNEGFGYATYNSDGTQIASGHRNHIEDDYRIRIWSVHGGVNRLLEGHGFYVTSVSYSFDGSKLVSTSDDQTLIIWDVGTGSLIRQITIEEKGILQGIKFASFSPDGELLVVASDDNKVHVLNTKSGLEILLIVGHVAPVNSAFFSADGKKIISASNDKTVRIWNACTGKETLILQGHTGNVNFASYSPDDKYVVSASDDRTIRVWDTQTGQVIQTLEGHSDIVNTASFSSDGKRIVSASNDQTIKVWDIKWGTVQTIKNRYEEGIKSAQFSPDGKSIALASWSKITILPFPPIKDLIYETRERFKKNLLTPVERKQYYLE